MRSFVDRVFAPGSRSSFVRLVAVLTPAVFALVFGLTSWGHLSEAPGAVLLMLVALASLGGVGTGVLACVCSLVYCLVFLPEAPFTFAFSASAWSQFLGIFITTHVAAVAIGMATDSAARRLEEAAGRLANAARDAEIIRGQELERQRRAFVGAVSHELRTPLTSILGYAELLEDGVAGGLTAGQRSYLANIQGAVKRLEVLVDDLLDEARLDAGTFKLRLADVDLGAKAREVAESLAPQALTREVELRSSVPPAALMVRSDPQRIGQVLTNLVGNAIKFSDRGGVVEIRLRPGDGRVRLEVVDNGIGIAQEDLDKLFLRFSQLPAADERGVGGTGLGLSIAKSIVEAHGGEIGVESEPRVGTVFWFELPS